MTAKANQRLLLGPDTHCKTSIFQPHREVLGMSQTRKASCNSGRTVSWADRPHWSYSQLFQFLRCPLSYYFERVLRLERLEKIVRDAGFTVKVLDADKVPTRNRSTWIARNAPGVDVIISHPQPVRTGLTLFDAMGAHNFPSLVFYETGYDLFTLRQASRRAWRIGQKCPCRVYYLYYRETMQARAMALMAQKLEASLALEGQFSAGGLAAMSAESGSLTMELAKSLVENLDFGDAERVWDRFRSERTDPCRASAEDGQLPFDQKRDAGRAPKSIPGGHYVQGLLFVP